MIEDPKALESKSSSVSNSKITKSLTFANEPSFVSKEETKINLVEWIRQSRHSQSAQSEEQEEIEPFVAKEDKPKR